MPGRRPDYSVFDEVLVERLVNDDPFHERIPAPEATEVTRRLARLGFSDGQIAYRLGFKRRSVQRIRTRAGIPAALSAKGATQHDRIWDLPSLPKRLG